MSFTNSHFRFIRANRVTLSFRFVDKLPMTIQSDSFQECTLGLKNCDKLRSYLFLGYLLAASKTHDDLACLREAGLSFFSVADAALVQIEYQWEHCYQCFLRIPDKLMGACWELAKLCDR